MNIDSQHPQVSSKFRDENPPLRSVNLSLAKSTIIALEKNG